jgi:hypothetical protein
LELGSQVGKIYGNQKCKEKLVLGGYETMVSKPSQVSINSLPSLTIPT